MVNIKIFLVAFAKSLLYGIIANISARLSIFPIMIILNNKWINIISLKTVHSIYDWLGQIIGSIVFVLYMYTDLHKHNWSRISSIVSVIVTTIVLVLFGILLGVLVHSI